jgi:3-deoxy-7-phosphoheptulonate synthase
VAADIARQITGGSRQIFGIMVESHIEAGAQKFNPGQDDVGQLAYGQSITDACLGWSDSEKLLAGLAESVAARRA